MKPHLHAAGICDCCDDPMTDEEREEAEADLRDAEYFLARLLETPPLPGLEKQRAKQVALRLREIDRIRQGLEEG